VTLAAITACVFETAWPIWRLQKSCDRFAIPLHPYGLGQTYTDWPRIKITQMLEHFQQMKRTGATHILYTDGRDSFFLSGLMEIKLKYFYVGAPGCLMATETECYPRCWLADRFPDPGHHYRWLGSGQFMGELDYLIPMWQMLRDDYMDKVGEDQNEQGWMVQAFVDGKFGPQFVLDTECQVFQSAGNGDLADELQVMDGRIYNALTQTFPCAIHFNGGYSDPVTGKDRVMKPVWDAIGGWPL
jgi:hypothetical protein